MFQPRVFLLQLLELTNLVDLQPDISLLSPTEGLRGNSNPPDQLCERNSRLSLLEHSHDLFDVELLLLHGKSPYLGTRFCRKLTFRVDQEYGAALTQRSVSGVQSGNLGWIRFIPTHRMIGSPVAGRSER